MPLRKKIRKKENNSPSPAEARLGVQTRILFLAAVMGGLLILIIVQLYREQIISSEERQERITTQSVKRIRLPGKRGNIHTSDGVLIAGNTGTIQLLFFPEEMRKRKYSETINHMTATAEYVASAVGRKNSLTRKKIARHLYTQPAMPLTVMAMAA